MKKSLYFIFCLIASVLILGGFSPSSAEDNNYYVVQGTITSRINVGISGLKVIIIDKGVNGDIQLDQTSSDGRGNYQARFLLPEGGDRLRLQVQVYDNQNLLIGSSSVHSNASNFETIGVQIGAIIDEENPSKIKVEPPEKNARIGYGIITGYLLGVSGIYWTDQYGGQVIIANGGSGTLNVNGRVHIKLLSVPFGRISIAPNFGYQFNAGAGGSVASTSYGIVGAIEFIAPYSEKTETKGKMFGLTAEIGYYGQDIRNVVLDLARLTPGFSMAGHIYL